MVHCPPARRDFGGECSSDRILLRTLSGDPKSFGWLTCCSSAMRHFDTRKRRMLNNQTASAKVSMSACLAAAALEMCRHPMPMQAAARCCRRMYLQDYVLGEEVVGHLAIEVEPHCRRHLLQGFTDSVSNERRHLPPQPPDGQGLQNYLLQVGCCNLAHSQH